MNDFNKRWIECVARARQEADAEAQAPFGFATRVLTMAREGSSASPSVILYRMTLRTLAGATTLLVALLLLEAGPWGSGRMKVPHIENAVTQEFWLL